MLSKMSITKKVRLTWYSMEKNENDSDDFWHRKLTLKVKFWYFLTAPHYSNFQNLVISFEYSWFLAKNLSNFVSLSWKLHNRECHSNYSCHFKINKQPWFFWLCPPKYVEILGKHLKNLRWPHFALGIYAKYTLPNSLQARCNHFSLYKSAKDG